MNPVNLLYIDLFCGAGGTSTGVNTARLHGNKCAEVIACVNHDAKAIASHASNHPDALHFTEDIRTLELSPLVAHVEKCRRENPQALISLWASLECTNFSKANVAEDPTYIVVHQGGGVMAVYRRSFCDEQEYHTFIKSFTDEDTEFNQREANELCEILNSK